LKSLLVFVCLCLPLAATAARVSTEGFSIDVPEGWATQQGVMGVPLMARPNKARDAEGWGQDLLTVTSEPADRRRTCLDAFTQRKLTQLAYHASEFVKLEEEALDLPATPDRLVLVLDGVQDPHNLGACLRTAEAVGVTAVIIPKDRAVGLTPVARKAAAGAAERVPVVAVTNLVRTLEKLKGLGYWVTGLAGEETESIYDVDLTGPTVLVMGGEGEGLRRLTGETCDRLVQIPMVGKIESLNVSVAAAVCLYEAFRQRQAPAKPKGKAGGKKVALR